MRHIHSIIAAIFFAVFLPLTAQAQTWKPLCVNGGSTQGAHNATWQRLSTTSVGGNTWKPLGGCVPPPPPPPAVSSMTLSAAYMFGGAGNILYYGTVAGFGRITPSVHKGNLIGITMTSECDEICAAWGTSVVIQSYLPRTFFSSIKIGGTTFTSASATFFQGNGQTTWSWANRSFATPVGVLTNWGADTSDIRYTDYPVIITD